MDTTPTRHSPNAVIMLSQRLRHLYNVISTSSTLAQQCIKSYKCLQGVYKVSIQVWLSQFRDPRSNTVTLFENQRPA